ncbi:hypothetical protein [Microbacterium sp. MMO-10]|uniref:hypothetical protein n=1 Tax=Microbacterium sp. MMO-10 TaxID=3081272 RepID=UPI00301A4E1E
MRIRLGWGILSLSVLTRADEEDEMGHDKNDELREDRQEQEERRQHHRDEAFDETGGVDDEESQDERRKEGLDRI